MSFERQIGLALLPANLVLALFFCESALRSQSPTVQVVTPPPIPRFVGAERCRMCHASETMGDQYARWRSNRHALAFASLTTAKAREVAKKVGIQGDPTESEKCLPCHATGFGLDAMFFAPTYKKEEGVQCEACHGPGEGYSFYEVMVNRTKAESRGMIFPDKELCLSCHNPESPTYKPFDYEKALKKIAHPVPPEYSVKNKNKKKP